MWTKKKIDLKALHHFNCVKTDVHHIAVMLLHTQRERKRVCKYFKFIAAIYCIRRY